MLETTVSPERLRPSRRDDGLRFAIAAEGTRTPFFCSGCPHNTSTKVPDGALVGAGIGCHGMIVLMDGDSRGEVVGITQMGGEGAQWIGMAPFVDAPHLFQNLGDGTFCHSGQLAVQAAIAAGVTMTFKLLYNASGGDDRRTGRHRAPPVPQVATKLIADGVRRMIITTDEPAQYRGAGLPARTRRCGTATGSSRPRSICVGSPASPCSSTTSSARPRSAATASGAWCPTPTSKIVIDHRVCEGCGDCGVQSELPQPPAARHRVRAQDGDRPSQLQPRHELHQGRLPGVPHRDAGWPAPRPSPGSRTGSCRSRSPIVPAEGVQSACPASEAPAWSRSASCSARRRRSTGATSHAVDQTGLSQKAGPVVSTISIGDAGPGTVDVLLGFDLLVSVTPANLAGLDSDQRGDRVDEPHTDRRMVGPPDTATVEILPYLGELDRRSRAALNRYVDDRAHGRGCSVRR